MFSTLLYGYDMIGYVDGTYPCPLEMIKMGGTFTPNPEHKIWKRQDSLLLHAIMESVDSIEILGMLSLYHSFLISFSIEIVGMFRY